MTDRRSDSGASRADREAAELARLVAQRAIRRLDILEWVIFLVGAGLATLGGGLAAWLLSGIAGWDFWTTWVGASILFFVVPGTIAIIKIKREERLDAERAAQARDARGWTGDEAGTRRDADGMTDEVLAEERSGDDG